MTRDEDHYDLLGLSPEASSDEIRAAYRKLASKVHPDKGGTEALFCAVEEAYRVLGDPRRREEYDLARRKGANGVDGAQVRADPSSGWRQVDDEWRHAPRPDAPVPDRDGRRPGETHGEAASRPLSELRRWLAAHPSIGLYGLSVLVIGLGASAHGGAQGTLVLLGMAGEGAALLGMIGHGRAVRRLAARPGWKDS
jgi:curved DNA-binding protein CbpA